MKSLTVLWVAIATSLYLVLGMVAFHYIESGNEQETRQNSGDFLSLWLANRTCVSEESIMHLIDAVIYAHDQGISMFENETEPVNWSWHNSFFFVITVITTVGYGNQSPATEAGQMFCVFYAITGIPMCMILLVGIGAKISQTNTKFCNKVTARSTSPRLKKTLPFLMLVLVGSVCLIFLPCIMFSLLEGWSYSTAFYFVIISLSTIGFGDYVAALDEEDTMSHDWRAFYRLISSIWILVGLAWFASFISTVQEILDAAVNKTRDIMEDIIEDVIDDIKSLAGTSDDESEDPKTSDSKKDLAAHTNNGIDVVELPDSSPNDVTTVKPRCDDVMKRVKDEEATLEMVPVNPDHQYINVTATTD